MPQKSSRSMRLIGFAAAVSLVAAGAALYGDAPPYLRVGRTTVTQLVGTAASGLVELSTPLRNLGLRTASLEKVEVEVIPKSSSVIATPSDWDQVGIHPLQSFDERIDLVLQQDSPGALPRFLRVHLIDAEGNDFKRDLAVTCKNGEATLVDVLDFAKAERDGQTPESRHGDCTDRT